MLSQRAAGNEIAHAHIMRLEAVVVGGVDERTVRPRGVLQLDQLGLVGRVQRLLDEGVLAVLGQVAKDVLLGLIGRAHDGGVERIERHLTDLAPVRLLVDRIDDADAFAAGNFPSLLSLHAITNDHAAHIVYVRSPENLGLNQAA